MCPLPGMGEIGTKDGGLVGKRKPMCFTESRFSAMKRSCANIDITDVETIKPWVTECILRHKERYDFRKLVSRVTGINKTKISRALNEHDNAIFLKASDLIAEEAARCIKERNLDLSPVTYKQRVDHSTFKLRLIGNESAMQQVFDYIAVRSCADIWKRRIVPQQVAGLKGRGAIYATRMIQKWVDKDNSALRYAQKNNLRYQSVCKYFTKLDVTQCYPSLRVDRFMSLFRRDCKNQDMLWLWEQLLSSHAVDGYMGFMIGALCSQWACQYMISFIYRFLTGLHSKRRGKRIRWVTHVAIQMDDILLFGSNRKNLKKAVFAVIRYVKEHLGLTIKSNWQICEFAVTPVDIVGYKIYRNGGTSVRGRIFLRARRLTLRLSRRNKMWFSQAKRLTSYKGYFLDNGKHRISCKSKHSDSYRFSHKYNMYKLIRQAQTFVSKCEKGGMTYGYCLLYGETGNSYLHEAA